MSGPDAANAESDPFTTERDSQGSR